MDQSPKSSGIDLNPILRVEHFSFSRTIIAVSRAVQSVVKLRINNMLCLCLLQNFLLRQYLKKVNYRFNCCYALDKNKECQSVFIQIFNVESNCSINLRLSIDVKVPYVY